ncbi:MAG: MFS transporter [Caldilineaceae bacterium]|nr:MFS transporter [Caldilineaceae bacterium]
MTARTARRAHPILRRLLQVDQPVLARSDAEIEAEMTRNLTWNYVVNFLDGAFFWFGLSFISHTTILPLFVSKLTTSAWPIAILAMIGQASWYLPQLFTAGATERLARKKPVVVNLGFFSERLPLYLLPLAAWMSVRNPMLALIIFFVGYGAHGLGAGAIAPAWSDLLARCFPVNRRGRFFGITSFVGTGLGALGAAFSGWLLVTYPFPTNFIFAFSIAALAITLSWFFIALTREPVQALPPMPAARGQTKRKLIGIVQGDQNFRNYLITRILSGLGGMGLGFVTVAALIRWEIGDGTVGLFTAATLVGQTVGNLLAGIIADRYGHRISLIGGFGAAALAYGLAWAAPAPSWYTAVFVLLGISGGMTIVSGVLINLEFSRAEHRPTYIGIANTTAGIGSVLAPLVGGLIAAFSYQSLFLASATLSIAAMLMLILVVREPRTQRDQFDLSAGAKS